MCICVGVYDCVGMIECEFRCVIVYDNCVPSEATLPHCNDSRTRPSFPLPFCSSFTTDIPIAIVFKGARTIISKIKMKRKQNKKGYGSNE